MISRYNHIVALCDDIKVKDFESLPLSISYEISKESCPEFIREKVLNGQIKTKAEIKKAIKEVQEKKSKAEEIQEAEIVEEKVPYTYVKKMISELSTKLKDLDTFAKENEGLSKEDYNKLQEIINFANQYKIKEVIFSIMSPLGKMAKSTLKCNSVVVPLQDKAPVRFIVMNFEIGRRPYEMEAVFCNEKMLMVGENSGIWTRLEWINEFNVPMFNIGTALHPYWRPE